VFSDTLFVGTIQITFILHTSNIVYTSLARVLYNPTKDVSIDYVYIIYIYIYIERERERSSNICLRDPCTAIVMYCIRRLYVVR